MKLSPQEQKIVNYLSNKSEVFWEELAQFAKRPSSIKLKTIKRVVSDLRKKYQKNNLLLPFTCSFSEMARARKMLTTKESTEFNGQKLVKVERTTAKAAAAANLKSTTESLLPSVNSTPKTPELILKPYSRQIITKSGAYALLSEEFEIAKYFLDNRGKFVSLEELRDKVCFPKFGSKTPARWFAHIQRRVINIRRQIPEIRNLLLTARQQNNTGYILN